MSEIADDLRVTEDDTFDLYVGRIWKTAPLVRDAEGNALTSAWDTYPLDTVHSGIQIDGVRLWSGGIMYLGLPWDDARRYLRALRGASGGGILVPTKYREPRIRPDEGLALAKDEFARIREEGVVYSDIGGPADEYCCWRYDVANLTAQAEGFIPGVVSIYIHKLSGRVCSAEEIRAWIQSYHAE